MFRTQAVSLLIVGALTLGGCGKKKNKSGSKAPPPAAPMAAKTPAPDRPAARPAAPSTPRPVVNTPPARPGPPVVELTAEAESLAKVVESALRSGRPGTVVALAPTRATVKGCPNLARDAAKRWGSFEKAVANTKDQVRTAFKRCAALGSWAKAKRTATRQTRKKPLPVDQCKRMIEHGHIYLSYVIGSKPVTVKLASPTRVDGKSWVLLDGIRCRLSGDVYR